MLQILCVVVGTPRQMVCVNPYTLCVLYLYVLLMLCVLLRRFPNWWPERANFTPNLVLIWFCLCVITGELGAWITANSCENASSSSASSSSSSSSSYSTRSTQSLENSLRTTTRPTFIAQYPQPGYFAVLLVSLISYGRSKYIYIVALMHTLYMQHGTSSPINPIKEALTL